MLAAVSSLQFLRGWSPVRILAKPQESDLKREWWWQQYLSLDRSLFPAFKDIPFHFDFLKIPSGHWGSEWPDPTHSISCRLPLPHWPQLPGVNSRMQSNVDLFRKRILVSDAFIRESLKTSLGLQRFMTDCLEQLCVKSQMGGESLVLAVPGRRAWVTGGTRWQLPAHTALRAQERGRS